MLDCNLEKSLLILNNLFNTDEFGLLNGLIWAHRRFLKALDLYENQSMSTADIFNNLKITVRKSQDEYKKGFANYSFYHAAYIYSAFSELDYYLKILPDKLKLVKLQEFIVNFITKRNTGKFLNGELKLVQK